MEKLKIDLLDEIQKGTAYQVREKCIIALEKQIGQKPVLKHDVGRMHINRGDKPHKWMTIESDNWHCPVCDGFVGEHLTMSARNFSHDQQKKAFCEKCGQKIDWSKNNELPSDNT